jgi:uncharacterized phage protein (TIGR02220 family)
MAGGAAPKNPAGFGLNYYERYCGDYARDTRDLSLLEHGVYTLLLDTYYSTEHPLPSELDRLYRICSAITPDEQRAVERVAERFFPMNGDGLRHNKRADVDIPAAQARIAKSRDNGKRGGRPKGSKNKNPKPRKNPAGSPEETRRDSYRKPDGLATGNPAGLLPSTSTNSFSSDEEKREGSVEPSLSGDASAPDLAGTKPDPKTVKRESLQAIARGVLAFLNERAGRKFPPTDSNVGIIVARLKEGFTETQVRQVIANRVRKWKGDDKMGEYLAPDVLFNRTKFSKYVGFLVDVPDGEAEGGEQ